ncbi:hypothetical protein EGW08_018321 [Elysia chlorotica]|uniref:Acyltransferase 3 domain-containing protein n=1 Tax=Elysia chlorotica TaxID=188477 RepID=A0A3S1B7H0_ELYCH|nr:hypothetical protein EGW08_018321 [Elysia chlorotica]
MPVWKIQSAETERLSSNGASLGHGKSQDLRAVGDYGSLNPRKESTERTPSHHMEQDGGISGIVIRAVLVFSIYTNGRKLLDTKEGASSIRCLHGIRFFSMAWVLLSHFFTFGAQSASNAYSKASVWNDRWTFLVVNNASVTVDTFFVMSGLLVSFSTLRQLKSKGWKINWVRFYVHRYWRLTPTYMMVLLLTLGLQQYCGEGPKWPSVSPSDKRNCEKYWWTNLLYINNFWHFEDNCMAPTWYLAVDMQFYLISPILLLALYFHKRLGLLLCCASILVSALIAGGLSIDERWPAGYISMLNPRWKYYYLHYYYTPWCRFGPFGIGILTGFALLELPDLLSNKLRMTRSLAMTGWLMAAATALAVVFGLDTKLIADDELSVPAAAAYNAFGRNAWAISVAWVILACSSGWGGFVNTFLSWPPFVLLSRLGYMAYLVHTLPLYVFLNAQETAFNLSVINAFSLEDC